MIGKLIIIEGGDGAGKATQTALLSNYFTSRSIACKTSGFPRYETFYGKLVKQFLEGKFGKIDEVSPYLISLPYAFDRLSARSDIVSWLDDGNIVILDRYVPSSLAHQAAKLPVREQQNLISWIEHMEYDENKLPRPDLVIYLKVPWEFSRELIAKDSKSIKDDIAEKSAEHQKKTQTVFEELAKRPEWKTIECVKNGTLRTSKNIHTELLPIVEQIITNA